MLRSLPLALLALLLIGLAPAQAQEVPLPEGFTPHDQHEDGHLCATMARYPNLLSQNGYKPTAEQTEYSKAAIAKQLSKMNSAEQDTLVIPVVVHVIHNGVPVGTRENIADEQVISQIEVMNEDFLRLMGTNGFQDPRGVNSFIKFELATVDPDGNPTNGITRTMFPFTAVFLDATVTFDETIKPMTQWDPNRYMNMWSADFGPLLLGYAQFPEDSGLEGMPTDPQRPDTDGVTANYNAFGSIEKYPEGTYNTPFDLGRTMTHEVGHYLGLRHIWGDGDCAVDDFVGDTPNAGDSNGGCAEGDDSCADDEGTDMVQNYMDYSNDACMSVFTDGQKARMLQVLSRSPRRASLVGNAIGAPGVLAVKRNAAPNKKIQDGDIQTITLTVTNNSAVDHTNVTVTDDVAPVTNYIDGSASKTATLSADGRLMTFDLGTIAAGETAQMTYQVQVDAGGGTTFLYENGMEDTADFSATPGVNQWSLVGDNPRSGLKAWFAADPDNQSLQMLDQTVSTELPAGAQLRFWHEYNTEAGFDGGKVEISTNGGTTYTDLGDFFVENGYSDEVAVDANPTHNGPTFGGTSGGYIRTVADLSSFEGRNVRFRFTMGSDVLTPGVGWWVDDLDIVSGAITLINTATLTSAELPVSLTSTNYTDVVEAVPVEMTSFEAASSGSDFVLTWTTASEENNAGFEVEMAREGEGFRNIGFEPGNGTTSATSTYRFPVKADGFGTYRFRLKQIDFDGGFAYSDETEAAFSLTKAFALEAAYPNPFTARSTVRFAVKDAQPVTVTLYNAIGQKVATLYDGTPEANASTAVQIEGGSLANGLYLVRLTGEGFSATQKVTLVK